MEMFPEEESGYSELRNYLREIGSEALLADVEATPLETLRPLVSAGVLDVAQPDIRPIGYTDYLPSAAFCEELGAGLNREALTGAEATFVVPSA